MGRKLYTIGVRVDGIMNYCHGRCDPFPQLSPDISKTSFGDRGETREAARYWNSRNPALRYVLVERVA